MRYTFSLFVLLASTSLVFGQTEIEWGKYKPIEYVKGRNVVPLAKDVTEPYETPDEKIQAIYYWVTHNIRYDYKKYEKSKKKKSKKKKHTKKELKEQEDKDIWNTLSNKKGICGDYTAVFKAMCEGIGIQCKVVTGYAKGPTKISSLGEKHAWNAVYVNDNWFLVDPTFGSGYVDDENNFKFLFEPSYLFPNPDAFKMNHHPSQEKWQITDSPLPKEDYKRNPGIGSGYLQYDLDMLTPNDGKLTVEKAQGLAISFYTEHDLEELNIASLSKGTELEATYNKQDTRYTINVNTDEMKSGSYGIYNGRTLLFSYRINIK